MSIKFKQPEEKVAVTFNILAKHQKRLKEISQKEKLSVSEVLRQILDRNLTASTTK